MAGLIKITVDGSPNPDVALAFQGRLQEEIDRSYGKLAGAYPRAMDRGVTKPGKQKLRATIEATGFYKASALARTWRGFTYPAGRGSLEPVAFFKTRAATIISAFEDGATITAASGRFLTIPEGPAKAIVHQLNRARARSGVYKAEDNTAARVAAALGVELTAIMDRDGSRGVLVAKSGARLTPTGRFAKRQRGEATVLFALVRQATLKPRKMGREVLTQIKASFLADFTGALVAELPRENR